MTIHRSKVLTVMKVNYILSHSLLDPVTEQVTTLKQDLGVAGYGTLWSLLEMLIASEGLSLSLDYAALCHTMKCDRATLRSVVEDYSIFTLSGNNLSCTYITEEVERQNARSIKRHERARKAAKARWGSRKSESDATSIRDVCSKHKNTNACSITSCKSDESETKNATSITSRAHVRPRAHAKRKNNSYSVSQSRKPEKINYPPYTPLLFAGGEKAGRYVVSSGAGGDPITDTLRGELLVVRRELEGLKRKLSHPDNPKGSRSCVPSTEATDEIVATLEKPWQELVCEWVTYRREIGSPIRGRLAIGKFYDRLHQLSGGDPSTARQIINRSMANGYKGIDLRTTRYTSGSDPFRTDDNGRVVDSTVGQDYSRNLSIRDCFRLKAEGRL